MKRFVKWLTIAIPLLFAVFVGGAYVLPADVNVRRAVTIEAPPDKVFPYLNDLKAFTTWSPWSTYDPKTVVTYDGPVQGVGQTMTWSSDNPNVGKGTQTIVESDPDKRVVSNLDFGDMGKAKAFFDLAPEGQGTKVTWGLDTTMNSPFERWLGLWLDNAIGSEYDRGLKRLKALVETGAVPQN
ncbi:MAG: SRPBCC family protein [Hyphomicrobiales bacterium]